uniref:Uncharacterized protein n=2 Tax=Magallana gigas TaxID=29159 RepID=A0A8W8L6V5_MAGGI|nr:uncharacterized protein LOC105336256 isoform X1 [Crassostrea gigas]
MTAEILMKNVYTFANILSQAGSDIVAKWNHISLNNAFNWADYCIKVFQQIENKPYRGEIEKHMTAMTLHLHPPSCLKLRVEDLGKARVILERTLLQNPYLPEKLSRTIIEQKQKSKGNNLELAECQEIVNEVTRVSMLMKTLQTDEDLYRQTQLISEATALLSTVISLSSCSSKSQRFECYVYNLLSRLAKKVGKLDIILKMLCVLPSGTTYTDSQLQDLHNIIVRWLSEPQNSRFLVTSCKVLIQEACRYHTDLCQSYLDHIVSWAERLEPSYNEDDTNFYSWRYRCTESSEKGKDHRTFEKLCEHLENLLNVNKQCQLTLKHTLQSLKEKSYFNVYSDILKRLNQIAEY